MCLLSTQCILPTLIASVLGIWDNSFAYPYFTTDIISSVPLALKLSIWSLLAVLVACIANIQTQPHLTNMIPNCIYSTSKLVVEVAPIFHFVSVSELTQKLG